MTDNAKKTHIFDVDHTVVRKTSSQYFLLTALKEKIIKFSQVSRLPFDLVKYKLARPDMDFIENTVKRLSGIKKSDIEQVCEICFEKRIKPNIYKEAAFLIEEAQKNAEKVIFASSSFDFIIRPIERYFGIEGSLATKMKFKDGITTGSLDGKSCFGEKKKTAALEWINNNYVKKDDVYFYSDSYTDIPLLEYCGNPVAVNPDRILAKKAKQLGWKIIKFKEVLN